jgi:hypothetical protein
VTKQQEQAVKDLFGALQRLLAAGVTLKQLNNRFEKWLAATAPPPGDDPTIPSWVYVRPARPNEIYVGDITLKRLIGANKAG